jgi:hypothetical protein
MFKRLTRLLAWSNTYMEMPTPTNPRSISHPEMTGSELNALKANIRAVIDSANVMNIISNTKDDIRVAEFAVP